MSLEVDSAGSVARHWERGPEAEALLGSGPEAAPPLQIRHEPREPRPGRRGWGPVSLLDTLHSRVANWSAVDTDTAGQATYFKPGDMVGMSLEEWLQHATVMGAGPMRDAGNTTGSLLDLPNTNVRMNTDKKSKVSFPPFRMTGLELTLDMSFQNQEVHGRVDHAGTVLSIEVVARPDWESMPVVYNLQPLEPVSGNGMTVKRHFYGVRVRFVSGGRFDSKSYPVMFGAISSFILYLQLPGMLVAAIAVFLLGVPSAFYYEAANERMELKRIANSYIARALGYCSSFRAAADRGKSPGARVASGGFSRQCLNEEVRNLAESEQLDATGTPKMVDLLLEEHDTDKNGYLSVEDLTLASLAHEMTTLKGIGDLMNEDRQKFVFERLFVPEVKVEDRRAIALRAKRAALAAQREQLRARNSQAEAFAQQRPSQTRASRLSAARRRPAGEGSASEAASSDLPASSDLAQAEAQGEAAEEAAAAAPVARIPAAQADPLGAGDPPQGAPTPAGL